MTKRSWVVGITIVLLAVGLAHWAMSYIAMRASLSKELSLFNQVHSAAMVYHMDTGSYPASLDVPDLQRYFKDIDDAEWTFLRQQGLAYTPPTANDQPAIILRISTSWSIANAHSNGNRTYGWEHQPR